MPHPGAVVQLVVFERRDERARRRAAALGRESGSMGAAALGFETLESVCHGQRRLGALLPGQTRVRGVVDLNRALAVKLAAGDAGAPEAEADSLLPADVAAFLRRLPDSAIAARTALDFVADALMRYDAPDLESAGVALPRAAVRLSAPVPRPGKLVAVAAPAHDGAPVDLFLVAPTAVSGPEDDVLLPSGDAQLECRGQLAAVIGRRVRAVEPARALDCVAGYCASLAFSVRGGSVPAGLRDSGDGFAPLGPALVTADALPDPHDLHLEMRVSGRTLQAAHTKQLPVFLPELIARASAVMTLEPGDVVLSGAPLDGAGDRPPALREGDVVEVEIERVGRLAIHVRDASRR